MPSSSGTLNYEVSISTTNSYTKTSLTNYIIITCPAPTMTFSPSLVVINPLADATIS